MADIDIQNPGASEADLREALVDLVGWRLHDEWDHAINGTVSSIDFINLAPFSELYVVHNGLTKSTTATPRVLFSLDNGITFLNTSGDYSTTNTLGVTGNGASAGDMHSSGAASARYGTIQIFNTKNVISLDRRGDERILNFDGPISGVRIYPTSGDFTGGTMRCYVK